MPKLADSINAMQVVRDTKSMTVTLNAVDRSTEKIIRTETLEWAKVHATCKNFISLYGLIGFARDRNSSVQGVLNRLDAYRTTFDETLLIGNLVKDREKQGKRLSVMQAEVLAKHYKVTMTQIHADWSKLDEEKKEKLLTSAVVVKMMAKAAKVPQKAEGISFDDLVED